MKSIYLMFCDYSTKVLIIKICMHALIAVFLSHESLYRSIPLDVINSSSKSTVVLTKRDPDFR